MLLVDEVDRADDEFEAFLLEVLSTAGDDPELGTVAAGPRPSSSSRPTAPARCTTPSSGAASTTGSSTPASSARSRSWPPAPEVSAALAGRSCGRARIRRTARCSSRPASPRRSTGRGRSHELGARDLDTETRGGDAGRAVKYREDAERVGGRSTRCSGDDDVDPTAGGGLLGFARALRAAGVAVTADRERTYLGAVARSASTTGRRLPGRAGPRCAPRRTTSSGTTRCTPRSSCDRPRPQGSRPVAPAVARASLTASDGLSSRGEDDPDAVPARRARPRSSATATSARSTGGNVSSSRGCSPRCSRGPPGGGRTATPRRAAVGSTRGAPWGRCCAGGGAGGGAPASPRHPTAHGRAPCRRLRLDERLRRRAHPAGPRLLPRGGARRRSSPSARGSRRSPARSPSATPTGRSSRPGGRSPTGPVARGSPRASGHSSTAGAGAAWPGARSSSSSAMAGSATSRRRSASRCDVCGASPTGWCG